MGILVEIHRVAVLSTDSRSNWNLEMLVFVEENCRTREKPFEQG